VKNILATCILMSGTTGKYIKYFAGSIITD